MCGIVALSTARGLPFAGAPALRAGLLAVEHRGRHATGIAWRERDHQSWYAKDAVTASRFALPSMGHLTTALGHTRWATQGSPANNANNHPIIRPGIMLVHNGHIDNDAALFRELDVPRDAEVDSEAAAAVIVDGTGPLNDRLRRIRGRAALLWMTVPDVDTPPHILHAARLDGSPLWLAQSNAGHTVFASTESACRRMLALGMVGHDRINLVTELPEWTYVRVRRGVIEDWTPVVPPPSDDDAPVAAWERRSWEARLPELASSLTPAERARLAATIVETSQVRDTSAFRPADGFNPWDDPFMGSAQARARRRGELLFPKKENK